MTTAQTHRPYVLPVGALSLVIPTGSTALTRRQMIDFACASVLEADGVIGPARELIADLERRLGVHDAHREALALSPEAVAARIRQAKRRALQAQHQHASRLPNPNRTTRPSAEVQNLLDQAEAKRAIAEGLRAKLDPNKRSRPALQQIKEHETAAKLLEREAADMRLKETDERWLNGATRETLDLARARGEDVEHETIELATFVTDEHGARLLHKTGSRRGEPVMHFDRVTRANIASRGGGLQQALDRGYLDGGRGAPKAERLYETGVRWGDAYEAVAGMTGGGEGGGGGFGPKGPQIRIVEAGEALAIMRVGLTPKEVDVLNNVCGEGQRTRDAAGTRGGIPATQRRLRNALRIALENWKAAKEAGQVGQAAEQVQRATRALAKIR